MLTSACPSLPQGSRHPHRALDRPMSIATSLDGLMDYTHARRKSNVDTTTSPSGQLPLSSTGESKTIVPTRTCAASLPERRTSTGSQDDTTHDTIEDNIHPNLRRGSRCSSDGPSPTSEKTVDGDKPKPSWIDLKTKAGKDRKRLPQACSACHRKKIRCSGERPTCQHCARTRVSCVYKTKARRPPARTDFVTRLHRRLKGLEDQHVKAVAMMGASGAAELERASMKLPATSPDRLRSSRHGRKRTAEEAFHGEIEAWASFKAPDRSGPRIRTAAAVGHGADEAHIDPAREGTESLPSPDLQIHLAEVYFEYLYGQTYHLLHKPTYMRDLR